MQSPPTIVIRHRKENLKKCSLRGLEGRSDMHFIAYPFSSLPPLENYIMLVMESAPFLSKKDVHKGILLLDSTWAYLPKMVAAVEGATCIEKRCLPENFITAYPRDSKDCVDPKRGLATLEALYCSYIILGKNPEGLLDNYYWQKRFIELNFF